MRPIATGVHAAWSVYLSVSLCVWTHGWALQKWLNRSKCRLERWHLSVTLGLSAPLKYIGSLFCGVRKNGWTVAWSLCLCVGNPRVLCNNGWTDRDAVWRTESRGYRELYVLGEVNIGRIHTKPREWQLGGAAFCQITLDTSHHS